MPKATNKASDYIPTPAGVHQAVCYGVIDIGTQPAFGSFPPRRKVMILWELPDERIDITKDGAKVSMPRAISKDYTLSLDKKANLRKDLVAWRGREFTEEEAAGFEVGRLIGANCQLSVVHKKSTDGTRTYANVGSIMPLSKGAKKLEGENNQILYDIPAEGEITFPDGLPEWIVNKIKNSEEYGDRINPHRVKKEQGPQGSGEAFPGSEADESVPF